MVEVKMNIEDLAIFCKKKGFVYPTAEIYGGLAGFWDFGHLGVEFINNLKKEWWKFNVHQREDMVGIDGSIITHPNVWEASGHVGSFSDVFVVCKKCKKPNKVDRHELEEAVCGFCKGELDKENSKDFNLLFDVNVGAENTLKAYLRGETAQLIFTNFKATQDNARMKLPFGIAQIGKAFRNEIAPREFLFRTREFEQMEIEYFIAPNQKCPYLDEIGNLEINVWSEDMQKSDKEPKRMKIVDALKKKIIKRDWHAYWIFKQFEWFILMGANPDKFRIRQHVSDEKSHYSSDTWDFEYEFPMGYRELEGFADRGTYDLTQHQKFSKKKLEMNDPEYGKVLPEVVCEPSLGIGRAFLVLMLDAYENDKKRGNVVLHLSPKLAPYKVAVFPLISKGETYEAAYEIYKDLLDEFNVFFDKSGSIGRRYARQDETGTPFCITVDTKSLEDKNVTIRERDSTKQIRVEIKYLRDTIRKLINDDVSFEDAGEIVNKK